MSGVVDWSFPSNGDAEIDGFNNASMDTFRGQMLFSLIRETIQNSMDARVETTAPVHVAFKLENVSKDSATGIPELLKYLNLASETSKKQHGNKSDAFNIYQRAI